MSYCLNPACPNPENLTNTEFCQACGTKLLLRDRYQVVQALGQGGFGSTYLATDESLPGAPSCVIKQLRPTSTASNVMQMARDLFRREAKTLGKIGNHPQVPRLLDYFEENQEFYLVQEYIHGATLQQEVKAGGPFTEAGAKQFLSEILPVLQYIHSQQVIHRDIKPANIIRRTQDAKLVLIDFGAVKDQVNQTATSASDQTALTAYAIGTPGYAPPEQMAMRPVYASDLYALGVTCIYLLTGKAPKDMDYDPATGELLWQKYVHASPHFIEVLKKSLEVSVRHRYQSAAEMLRALDLEPYMDSLAKGLVSQPQNRGSQGGRGSDHNSGASLPSSMARVAMSIRARQNRDGAGNTSEMTSGRTMGRGTPSSSSKGKPGASGGDRPKPPAKLDANGLQIAYNRGKRDFTLHDFSQLNLHRYNLSGANFNQAKFDKVNLQGANLAGADFGRASLNSANLRDANLTKAYMSYANLQGADLRGADLTNAYLSNANLRGANLCGANLTGAKVTDEQLSLARTNWATVKPGGKKGLW